MSTSTTETRICKNCGQSFSFDTKVYALLGLKNKPKRCPKCIDIDQRRPTVCLSREVIFEQVVTIGSLPYAEFEPWKAYDSKKNMPVWRSTNKGSQYGKSWSGRFEIFAHMPRPPKVGDVVRMTVVKATHQVAKKFWAKGTLEHGTITGWKQISIVDYDINDPMIKIEEEDRYYIRLDVEMDEEPTAKLVYVLAKTKTTLKGLGRQYWDSLSGNPLFKSEIHGGYRSGRAYTDAWLAVVNAEHSITYTHKETGRNRTEIIS